MLLETELGLGLSKCAVDCSVGPTGTAAWFEADATLLHSSLGKLSLVLA